VDVVDSELELKIAGVAEVALWRAAAAAVHGAGVVVLVAEQRHAFVSPPGPYVFRSTRSALHWRRSGCAALAQHEDSPRATRWPIALWRAHVAAVRCDRPVARVVVPPVHSCLAGAGSKFCLRSDTQERTPEGERELMVVRWSRP
jgi:hypothetical protein